MSILSTASVFLQQNPQCFAPVYNTLEASVNHVQATPQNFSLQEKVRSVFACMDATFLAWSCHDLTHALGMQFYSFNGPAHITLFLGWLGLSMWTANTVHNRLTSDQTRQLTQDVAEIAEYQTKKVQVALEGPDRQLIEKGLLVARLTMVMALAIFTSQPILFTAISLASLSYSWYKLEQQQWMKMERTFISPNIPAEFHTDQGIVPARELLTQQKVQNFFPLIKNNLAIDNCAICYEGSEENEIKPNIYFCQSHVYHLACIAKTYPLRSKDIPQNTKILGRVQTIENGTIKDVSYEASLSASSALICPTCRTSPPQQEVYMWFSEKTTYSFHRHYTGHKNCGPELIKLV